MTLPAKEILFLLTRPPYPANDGTKIKILTNILDAVRGECKCTLAIISDVPPDAAAIAYLEKEYGNVRYFYRSRLRRISSAVWGWLCGYPLQVGFFYSSSVARELRKYFKDADVIYAHTLRFGKYIEELPENTQKKVLLDFNDAISFNYHTARQYAHGFWRYVYAIEESRVRRYEKKLLSHPFHFSIVCEADRNYLSSDVPITVIRHGISDKLLEYQNNHTGNGNLVFLGNMFYPPNADSIRWLGQFLEKYSFDGLSGSILDVGGRTPEVLSRSFPNVSFVGFVDDLSSFIIRHRIFVAPLHFGAGVQTKVLEAMALGMPVVTSPIGARGIDGAKNGENIFIVNMKDEAAWQCVIVMLLNDQALRMRVGEAARDLIRAQYTASRARVGFRDLVNNIARHPDSR